MTVSAVKQNLRIHVTDKGMGIPENEIPVFVREVLSCRRRPSPVYGRRRSRSVDRQADRGSGRGADPTCSASWEKERQSRYSPPNAEKQPLLTPLKIKKAASSSSGIACGFSIRSLKNWLGDHVMVVPVGRSQMEMATPGLP